MEGWWICLLCGADTAGTPLCPPCTRDLPALPAGCRRCGVPLAGADQCGPCSRRPPPFDGVFAPFPYAYPLDAMIRGLKYHRRTHWLGFLGSALAAHAARCGAPRPDCLIPIPLHWRRYWQRGFNQAGEIARETGKALVIPVREGILVRRRATASQAGLPPARRRRNLRGAFAVRRPLPGQRLVLVDDVLTTGATAGEAAAALKRAGAREVWVWVVARTT